MNNVVIKVTDNQIKAMEESYQNFLVPHKNPHAMFVAKKNNTTITAYTSKTVMFQGKDAEKEAKTWRKLPTLTQALQQTKKAASQKILSLSEIETLSVLGSDEVGNGSYFGPLTVCATYVDKTKLTQLRQLGVCDSKLLIDSQIIKLASQLKNMIPYQLLVLTPKEYNKMQPSYNAVRMKVHLHNKAIFQLLKDIAPVKPEAILIDQFTPEANFKKYAQLETNQIKEKMYFATKGEQYHLAVAAASIISRASFLEELKKESVELGLTLPSGAGTKSDQVAAKILQKGGENLLKNYAKLHFANTKKAKDYLPHDR